MYVHKQRYKMLNHCQQQDYYIFYLTKQIKYSYGSFFKYSIKKYHQGYKMYSFFTYMMFGFKRKIGFFGSRSFFMPFIYQLIKLN